MRKRGHSSSLHFPCIAQKRGQLTLFIIVAIVIVIAIIIYFVMIGDLGDQTIEGSEVIQASLVDCLEYTTKNSLYFVAYQGGYNDPPEKSFSFSPTFFPYYYYEGENLMPTLENFEVDMAKYVDENLGDCFDEINGAGFEIAYERPETKVEITPEGVEYIVDFPVTLSREGLSMTVEMSKYPVFFDTKLYYLYEVSSMFVNDQVEDSDYYCISCIASVAEEQGIRFYIFPLLDDVYIMMAFEEGNNPLILNFVAKYKPSSGV